MWSCNRQGGSDKKVTHLIPRGGADWESASLWRVGC